MLGAFFVAALAVLGLALTVEQEPVDCSQQFFKEEVVKYDEGDFRVIKKEYTPGECVVSTGNNGRTLDEVDQSEYNQR